MNTNEETKYMNPEEEPQDIVEENEENEENAEDSKKETWKAVSIGGVSGILMGAGGLYALNAFGETTEGGKIPVPGDVRTNEQSGMKVAHVSDDMSFGKAFATARNAVGEGGVFHWRGNVYNTYTKEEWDAMTPAERNAFARAAQPEIASEASSHPHRDHADHHDHHNSQANHHDHEKGKQDVAKNDEQKKSTENKTDDDHNKDDDDIKIVKKGDDDVHHASEHDDDGIHIVGKDEIDGHQVAFLDTKGDGEPDVAVIDVDDDGKLSDADLIIDDEGNAMTYGGEDVSSLTANNMDNSDLGSDMGGDGLNDMMMPC